MVRAISEWQAPSIWRVRLAFAELGAVAGGLVALLVASGVTDAFSGLADLIAAGGVIGGFLASIVGLVRGIPYESTLRWAWVGGVYGGSAGVVAFVIDRLIEG